MPPTGDLACNPSMSWDWEWSYDPWVPRPWLKLLSCTSQGPPLSFFLFLFSFFYCCSSVVFCLPPTHHFLYTHSFLSSVHWGHVHAVLGPRYTQCPHRAISQCGEHEHNKESISGRDNHYRENSMMREKETIIKLSLRWWSMNRGQKEKNPQKCLTQKHSIRTQ